MYNKDIENDEELNFLEEEFTKVKINTIDIINNNIKDKPEHNIINNNKSDDIIDVWTHIFNFLSYDGINEKIITSNDIKNAGKTWKGSKSQFEPRLLCKQDTFEKRPEIFKKNNLCILSIKNGTYLLTKTNIYYMLNDEMNSNMVDIIKLKKNNNSLLLKIGNSEMTNIDNLRYSGLFEQIDYLNETIIYGPVLNGRHRCSFTTKLNNKEIKILGSQYETDSCFESENKILLIEGKSGNNKSFNIRQLYYPYRAIYDNIKDKKQIIILYINVDKNNIIHIWSFKFIIPDELTSIKCILYKKYKLIN